MPASRKAVAKGAKDGDAPPGPLRGAVTLDLALSAPPSMLAAVPEVSWSPVGGSHPKQYGDNADG